jgi:hypothetical protein
MHVRLFALVLGVLLAGCDDERPPGAPAATPPAASAVPRERASYRVVGLPGVGVVAGSCRLRGEAKRTALRAWPGMGTEEGQDDESVAKGSGRALGGCFVSLAQIPAGKEWPEAMRVDDRTLTLTAVAGRYEPHLAWVRVGTQVSVENKLRMDIMVRVLQEPSTVFANFIVSPGTRGTPSGALLNDPAFVHVTEDSRRAFNAWIQVSPHPYVEITQADSTPDRGAGEYRLEGVPAGDYDIVFRHEPMDRRERFIEGRFAGYETGPVIELRRKVQVRVGETATVDFEIDAATDRR